MDPALPDEPDRTTASRYLPLHRHPDLWLEITIANLTEAAPSPPSALAMFANELEVELATKYPH